MKKIKQDKTGLYRHLLVRMSRQNIWSLNYSFSTTTTDLTKCLRINDNRIHQTISDILWSRPWPQWALKVSKHRRKKQSIQGWKVNMNDRAKEERRIFKKKEQNVWHTTKKKNRQKDRNVERRRRQSNCLRAKKLNKSQMFLTLVVEMLKWLWFLQVLIFWSQ